MNRKLLALAVPLLWLLRSLPRPLRLFMVS